MNALALRDTRAQNVPVPATPDGMGSSAPTPATVRTPTQRAAITSLGSVCASRAGRENVVTLSAPEEGGEPFVPSTATVEAAPATSRPADASVAEV